MERPAWRPPIKHTVASRNEGVGELFASIDDHIAYLENSGELKTRRLKRIENEITALLELQISRHVMHEIRESGEFAQLVADVHEKQKDPYSIIDHIIDNILK